MEPEDTIDYNIRKTWYNITKFYNKTANEYMGSTSLAMVLLNINIFDGTPSTQLGPNMGMESTSLSRSLNKLEEIGAIKRKKDPHDKRKTVIYLTEEGLKWRDIAKDAVINFNKEIFSNFKKEEIENFLRVLRKINKIISQKK